MQAERHIPQPLGIVVIGRNEGERLARCLASVVRTGHPVVYVDSGSSDGSLVRAASFGVDIVELDRSAPFSAARARNEGSRHLLEKYPQMDFIQFLDGDCTLFPEWLGVARQALEADAQRSAVLGQRLERQAGASIYNRLCAMEWHAQAGDLENYGHFGGDSMVRASVFRSLGGFRPDMIAGEDSEFGVRMGIAGFRVTKIDCPMTLHDANMTRFAQWWQRSVRAGHAIGQRFDINGRSAVQDCRRERNSTLFWGIVLPLVIALSAWQAPALAALLLAGYLVLGLRVWRHRRRVGDGARDAALYAGSIVIGKFANAWGLLKFFVNKLNRRYEIIEYK